MHIKNQHHVSTAGRFPLLANPGHHHTFVIPCILLECDIYSTVILELSVA
jgi:hypothetical protein